VTSPDKLPPGISGAASVAETPRKPLPPAAQRALAEAAERRAAIDAHTAALTARREINGRNGPEPVRYDDWEVKGIASDF
jgi:hypothetical protein